MQETSFYENEQMKKQREVFQAPSDASLEAAMKTRLDELKAKGHTLVRRVKVGRNEPCPCGSNRKFKKCCLK